MTGLNIFILLCAFAGIQQCCALKCYVCNSRINAGCDDSDIPLKYLVTCNPQNAKAVEPAHIHNEHAQPAVSRSMPVAPPDTNFTYCRKLKFSIPAQHNGDSPVLDATERVDRSCGYLDKDEVKGCRWQTSFGGIQARSCHCDHDACNSVGAVGFSLMFLTTVQVFLLLKGYVFH